MAPFCVLGSSWGVTVWGRVQVSEVGPGLLLVVLVGEVVVAIAEKIAGRNYLMKRECGIGCIDDQKDDELDGSMGLSSNDYHHGCCLFCVNSMYPRSLRWVSPEKGIQ